MPDQSPTSYAAFFGDAEQTFDLAQPHIVRELEAATGAGIGALVRRVIHDRSFAHGDLENTIRLGLIGGGGMAPKDAARLVAAYLPARPLEEAMLLAMSILGALFFGASRDEPANAIPDPDAASVLRELAEPAL